MRRGPSFLLIAAAVLGVGCVRRRLDGDASIYSPEPWIIAATALGATTAAVAGWFVRRRRKWIGYLLLGVGVLVLLTTVPGLALSRALVDSEHVEWNRGLNRFHFRFDDLAGIDHSVRKVPLGRTTRDVHYLEFTTKAGETTLIQVEPGAARYLQDAIPEILQRAKDRGVPCTEEGP
ncbi:hypothetical protein [Planctomyces sp. SH-PL62]|uniref:hypothetical protein n=1 Tax=Planctomyces sp. SH-PL62 TaxID=1636152 RepID=UPI00078E1D20|nr:hypothetical protein [Planctomyces sp. SH-PL62]AMV40846.1 hypothetical protein VT85_25660 [Planctomyces sp. SH-PL62]